MANDTKKIFNNDYNLNKLYLVYILFAFFNAKTLLGMLEMNSQISS